MLPDAWGSPEDHDTLMGHGPDPEPHEEPVIIFRLDWPGESAEVVITDWPSAFLVLSPYIGCIDRKQASIRVRANEDDNVEIDIRYRPNRQEIAFHTGRYEFAEETR